MTTAIPVAVPDGYRSRPLRDGDGPAVHRLIAATERDRYGSVETDANHVDTVTARPGLDPRRDLVVVTGGEAIVAWAWVNRRSEVHVHPAHRGRGLGTALLEWVQARARQTRTVSIAQQVDDADTAAARLLTGAGFTGGARAWLSGIDTTAINTVTAAGVEVRAFRDEDAAAAHAVHNAAFDTTGQRRTPLAEWAAATIDQPGFDAAASAVALIDGRVIGEVMARRLPGDDTGRVDDLAVAETARGRGVARALLHHAFAALARAGRRRCTVWTHTGTGALPMYQRVGMRVERTATVYFKQL